MTDIYIPLTTTSVDGSGYTSDDTIIVRGGVRTSGLRFQNFDGNGDFINIVNENIPNIVDLSGVSGRGCLSLDTCKYINLAGTGNSETYGIKITNDDTAQAAGTVWVYGESRDIKVSNLDISCIGNTSISGIGVQIQDINLTPAWTFSDFEIYNNYIHDTRYSGMYLGHNESDNGPYVGGFSIHDNLLEDLGSYGMTYKGVNEPNNYIFNNIIKQTGIVRTELTGSSKSGIGIQMFQPGCIAEVYNNWIEKTVGPGIKVGGGNGNKIYDNKILGCGTGNEEDWGHGIELHRLESVNNEVYDNIIIQPTRYGICARYNSQNNYCDRNLIGDAGLGESYVFDGGELIEGTGADANIYHADVADFGFCAWTDDGDYSNDDFSFCPNSIVHRGILRQKPLFTGIGRRFQ